MRGQWYVGYDVAISNATVLIAALRRGGDKSVVAAVPRE